MHNCRRPFAILFTFSCCAHVALGQATNTEFENESASAPASIEEQIGALLSIDDAAETLRAYFSAAERWADDDPISVFRVLKALPPSDGINDIERVLVFQWMAHDTASALRFFATLDELPANLQPVSGSNNGFLNIGGGLPISPDSALQEIFQITAELPSALGRSVRLQVIRRMADDDPVSAAELLEELPSDEQRQAAFSIYQNYIALNAEDALAWARSLDVPGLEQMVVQAMAANDPYGMLARARTSSDPIFLTWVAGGAVNAADVDKATLGNLLAQLPASATTASALESFANTWLGMDESAALNWIADSGTELPDALIRRAAGRAAADPDSASAYAQRLSGNMLSVWIEAVSGRYAREDPAMALQWMNQFRADPVYLSVVADIATRLARTDGPRAAELVNMLDGRERQGASWTVSRRWAETDPLAAIRWADSLPEDARAASIRAAVDEWHAHAPDEARNWAQAQRPGFIRDEALRALAAADAADERLRERMASPPPANVPAAGDASMQKTIFAALRHMAGNNDPTAVGMLGMLSDPQLRSLAEKLLANPDDADVQKQADEILAPEAGREYGMFGPVQQPASSN